MEWHRHFIVRKNDGKHIKESDTHTQKAFVKNEWNVQKNACQMNVNEHFFAFIFKLERHGKKKSVRAPSTKKMLLVLIQQMLSFA